MIQKYLERRRFPVEGKIRLGIRKKKDDGREYPAETEYFVLTDAPEVAKVYGDKPTSLEVMFPDDDLDKVMPNYYKWYAGGVKDKNGDIIGGKLNCYGDGVTAHHLMKRDPITRVVPTRVCAAEACPDWIKDKKQQCKAAMTLYLLLPRVSLFALYQIDTTSVTAIQAFIDQMVLLKRAYGTFKANHFTIYRHPTKINFVAEGKEKSSVHYILRVRHDGDFATKYGPELQQRVQNMKLGAMQMPEEHILVEAPMEDSFPIQSDSPQIAAPAAGIELVAEDAELAPLFDELCKLRGKANNKKMRLLTARKFEGAEDPKADLKKYLNEEIKKAQPAPPPVQQPALNADGLI